MGKWSQSNEEQILHDILAAQDITTGTAVEFGACDGYHLSNIRHLMVQGWTGYQLDIQPGSPQVKRVEITPQNINEVFDGLGLAQDFELLSIDIDGMDYWVWEALKYRPLIVVIEYNADLIPDVPITVPYTQGWRYQIDTIYHGASYSAMKKLGEKKGYQLVAHNTVNLFFVRSDINRIKPDETVPARRYDRIRVPATWVNV